jgi:predicted amino acid dehydrogenase
MVGLGAFTSILTNNGLTINDYEMAITSGNAFTVALTLLGVQHAVRSRGGDWSRVSIAVVGANGSIGQATARVLAPQIGRLLLVGSVRGDSLNRLQFTKRSCVEDALRAAAPGGGRIQREILRLAAESPASNSAALERALGSDFIETRTDFGGLDAVDVVVVATNSPDAALIRPSMVKRDAIVCCTSVPSNLEPAFAEDPEILAFAGGLACLPEGSEIRFVGLPKAGMTFGCLAETLLLGFDGYNHSFAKGTLQPSLVERTLALAASHGFSLGPLTLNDEVVLPAPSE